MSASPDLNHDPEVEPPDNGERGWKQLVSRWPIISIAAAVLVIAGLAFLAYSLSGGAATPLYPILPTMTPPAGTTAPEPEEIGFAELNADPAAFLGRRLLVNGDYTPLPAPECLDYTGPIIRWSLVAEELQLNAVGFEPLLALLEPGTEMTVTGFWQAYRGPLGCGKEPDDGTVWYLAVDRIVEPNPLSGAAGPLLTVIPGEELPTLSPEEAEGTPTSTLEFTPTITESLTLTATLGATLPAGQTSFPAATQPPVTPLMTAGSPVTTPETPDGGTPLTTPLGTPTPTGTLGTPGAGTPGLPTNTPSGPGYPPGTPTIPTTPTATTDPYP
jgi:hypothetical protein